jgi:hypothetical protein
MPFAFLLSLITSKKPVIAAKPISKAGMPKSTCPYGSPDEGSKENWTAYTALAVVVSSSIMNKIAAGAARM